jgi:hypothetical protein
MKLSQVNEAMNHKIVGGSDYQWNCFPNARFLDYESDYAHVGILYSTVTQEVYQADVSIKLDMWAKDEKPYRWTNPLFNDAYINEAKERAIDPDQAWDGVKWITLEVAEDWLEKAHAMFNGEEWDERIVVPIDLDDDLILQLAMEAHKRDITLNKMVEIVLQEAIDHHKGKV